MSASPDFLLASPSDTPAPMLPVALDAMGGDRAPGEIIEGARLAIELGIPVLLVGDPDRLGRAHDIPIAPALEVISMHDDPAQGDRKSVV